METLCLSPKGFDEDPIFLTRQITPAESDKQKLMDFAARIRALEPPVVGSPEAANVIKEVVHYLDEALYTIDGFCE
ncbi:hypothetical protein KKA14_02600 [bacterium]|nr:hypothetical protein [bacterium]